MELQDTRADKEQMLQHLPEHASELQALQRDRKHPNEFDSASIG